MAEDTTQEVTVKIIGEAESFKKSVKESKQLTTDLNKLTARYRKSGLSEHKALGKISNAHNKAQKTAGKEALAMEKKLQKAIRDNIKEIKQKQKIFRGNVDAIKDEVKALKQLEQQHRKIASFRKQTGTRSMGERFRGASGALGKGMGAVGTGVMALGGMIMGAVTAIVGTLISTVTSQIRQGYASYINFGRSRAGLAGMGVFKSPSKMFGRAERLGFSKTETVQHMQTVGRATGNINAVNTAQTAARSFGGDVGEVAGFMGTLTRAGQGFGGKMGTGGERQLRQILSAAFTSGLDKSRAGEHLTAVAQAVQSAQAVTGGRVDAAQISAMLSFFGRSNQPGLQGAAGMQQMEKLDSVIKQAGFGGGGDAVTSLIYQALGFGQAGGTTSFYDATKQAQRGVFGEGGTENLMKVFNRFAQTGGGPGTQKTNLEISRATGLSLDVVESIWKVIQEQGGGTEKAAEAIAAITKEQLPVDKQILNATKDGHLKVADRIAHLENRLIDIGEKNAEAIEQLQDVVNEVVDTLMPLAVEALKVIADVVKQIWEWLRDFGSDWRKQNRISEDLTNIEKQRNSILEKLEAQKITPEEATKQLTDLAGKAGAGEISLKDINPMVQVAQGVGHYGHRFGQMMGYIPETEQSALEQRRETAARAARTQARVQRDLIRVGAGWRGEAIGIERDRARLEYRMGRPEMQGPEHAVEREQMQAEIDRLRQDRDRAQAEYDRAASGTATAGSGESGPQARVLYNQHIDPASIRSGSQILAPTTRVGSGQTAFG